MAVPFNLDDEEIEAQIIRMLKIERLIKELLSVLRWTPWASVTSNLRNAPERNAARLEQHQQRRALLQDRAAYQNRVQRAHGLHQPQHRVQQLPRRPITDAAVARAAAGVRAQAQPLPDLVPANVVQPYNNAAEEKPTRTVMLQVELCPDCYYSPGGRRLKVVGATRVEASIVDGDVIVREDDGALLRRLHSTPGAADLAPDHHARECRPVVESRGSKIKRRLLSMVHPSKIETPLLTAALVVIGWKMFIKQ